MKTSRRLALISLGSLLCVASFGALAQASQGTADDAKKLVAAAAEHIKRVGPDTAMKDFDSDKAKWTAKDLSVWVMDTKGVMRYHVNPKMVGKDLLEVKDQSGRPYNKEMVAIGKSGKPGSVDYEWAHPETKKLVPKTAYLQPVPGTELFAGASVTH